MRLSFCFFSLLQTLQLSPGNGNWVPVLCFHGWFPAFPTNLEHNNIAASPLTPCLCFPTTWELTPPQGMTWWTLHCVLRCRAAGRARVQSGDLTVKVRELPQSLEHRGKRSTLTFGKADAFLPAGVWHDLASQSNTSPLPVWWSETPKSVEEEKFSSRSLHICKMVAWSAMQTKNCSVLKTTTFSELDTSLGSSEG